MTAPDLLEDALRYARLGWHIFPIELGTKRPLGSLVPNGYLDATCDLEVIRSWWWERPSSGIGLACTADSGRIVLDVDSPEAGEQLKALQRRHGALSPTLTVKTARGWHLHYDHPGGDLKGVLADGIDVKGAGKGGYVLLPPSLHPSGAVYRWHRWPHELADLPSWVVTMLRPKRVPLTSSSRRMSQKRLEALLRVVRRAVEGERNRTVFWAACRLAEAGASDEQVDQLYRAAGEVGLDHDEIARAIDNARGALR